MPPTRTACWAARLAALLAAACLAGCGADPGSAFHATVAEHHLEQGGAWDPPAMVPAVLAGSAGTQVTLPHARPRSIAEGPDSVHAPPDVSWYRIDVPPSVAGGGEPFLYLPRWQTIGVVAAYADDRLVHRTRGSRVWNSFNRPFFLPLADATGRAPRTVWIRIASQHGVGSALSTAWIGSENDLLWRHRTRSFLQNDLISQSSAAFLVIGLFSLAVWCVRRHEPMYALFFGASAGHFARMAHYVIEDRPLLIPDAWFGWMTVNSLSWAMACIFAFAFRVHGKRMPRTASVLFAVVALCTVLTLPVPLLAPHLPALLPLVYLVTAALTASIAVSGLWASWTARSGTGLVLFAWFTLNLPVGLHDLLLQTYRIDIERLYLSPYTAMSMFPIFLAIAYRRYVGALRDVETVNASLETRLAARERELTASHQQLRELERQQTLTTERQRLMQDMHDGIGSSLLSALRMVEHGRASSADTADVLKQCIDDLKLAIDSLHTADADLLGLLAAVRFRLAPRLHAAGIELRWSVRDLPPLPWLDPNSALHILRILQEVLANILKHSRASLIDVATADGGGEVLVRIRDNGHAFTPPEPAAAATAGKGLANIRHRAGALGARCHWTAWEGGGEFRLWLPVAGPATAR